MTSDGLAIGWLVNSEGPRLVVGAASGELRRELGPVAWSTLEILALAAHPTGDGQLTVALNARQVAVALGVGRETAGKALALLRRQGLIVFDQPRADGGHFTGTQYTIRVELLSEPEVPRDRTTRRAPRVSAPTLFDTPTTDRDDRPPDIPGPDDTPIKNGARESHAAATQLPEISHTLALSMPTDTDAGSERC